MHTQTHTHRTHMTVEAVIGVMLPQAKGSQGLQATTRNQVGVMGQFVLHS